MNDKIFLDSNILIYCYSKSDLKKQSIARALAAGNNVCIFTQVLNETVNVLNKKYDISWSFLESLITDFENNFQVHELTANDVRKGCRMANRYRYSFYDSMIISSAIECNCSVLYSEDFRLARVCSRASSAADSCL